MIIEVEPRVFRGGWYIPNDKQAKRNKPSTAWHSLRLDWTTGGRGFEVSEMKFDKDTGYDTWLKIAGTNQWVAFLYKDPNKGELVLGDLEAHYE